jgi:hypothetical protein
MSSPTIPDPNKAAIAGIETSAQLNPFEYLINALASTGQSGNVTNPITGQTQNYDFTGLGTADVQNQFQNQMAQTLLDIQKGLGPEFVAQRLKDLEQSDPTGFAAYKQLFDQIKQESAQSPANLQLSEQTQSQINDILSKSQSLDPQELIDVQQGARGGQVQNGIYLGNAPAQAEAGAVVGATDQKQAAGQQEAQSFLQSGVSPEDINYRKIQQDMANLGAFISGQDPTAQFSSISGAQSQAAPYPNSGFQVPTINEGQAAGEGIQNRLGIYQGQVDWSQNSANPYLAGLSTAANATGTAFNLGYSPWSTSGAGGGMGIVPAGL